MNNILCLVQARAASLRLPAKVLLKIGDRPMLWHVLRRLKKSKILNQICVATTHDSRDIAIRAIASDCGVRTFVGSETDVLDRHYQAADMLHASTIVRVTSDCPLVDPKVLDDTILYYLSNSYEYVCNSQFYVDGTDVEVFSFEVLEAAWKNAKEQYDREHVCTYMLKRVSVGQLPNPRKYPPLHLSVDTQADFDLVSKIYNDLGQDFTIDEAIEHVMKSHLVPGV